MKKKGIPVIITLVVWAVLFYIYLPAINIHSNDFWMFCVFILAAAIIINLWTIVKSVLMTQKGGNGSSGQLGILKKAMILPLALAAFYLVGNILSSPILRAGAYFDLMKVETGDFKKDIKEVDYNQIPILDKDSASRLAEREMGSLVDMVSQYEVSPYANQINYRAKPVRVTPLQYADLIKWITNRSRGIPGYIEIDMTTQDADFVRLEQGIRYSPSEHFGRNLNRYLRFRYPTAMFRGFYFEVDDKGIAYWIAPVEERTIGLFGGIDIQGAVVVNAVTGEHNYYKVADIPTWIDKVYDAELLVQQYDYHGTLKNGFINSILGQRDCLQTTEGYNYIALNDDVWVYTGVTSVTGDQSNVGFVLMNQRTKETKYYMISGAKEISAMSSAEGQVQHLGYVATFPLLLNVAGEPTYFLALKDEAGLVKKYAMVNIQKYQIVATGDTVIECEKNYKKLMSGSGINTVDKEKKKTVTGTITLLRDVVTEGNSYAYMMLQDRTELFEIEVKKNLNILRKKEGDSVTISFVPTIGEDFATVLELE